MDEILKALDNNQYFEAVKACDNLLKKKPLSWDEKYDVLIIKIKALIKSGLFKKSYETIKTAEKIKTIYSSFYYRALIDIYQNRDYISGEENLNKSLNICPYYLEKERGLIYAEMACLKALRLNYYAANKDLEKAKELSDEKDYLNYRLKFYACSRNFNNIIRLLKRKKNLSEDEIICYSYALMSEGYSKKAYRKLMAYYSVNNCQNYLFLELLFKSCLACGDIKNAKDVYARLLKTDMAPDESFMSFAQIIKNPEYKKLIYFKSARKNHLPDCVYTLAKNTGRNTNFSPSPLYRNWVLNISSYLTSLGFDVVHFKPSLQNYKKLCRADIPFVTCQYEGGKINYSLITGYDAEKNRLITQSFAPKHIEANLNTKEKKLTTICFAIENKNKKDKIRKILGEKGVLKHTKILYEAFAEYLSLNYKTALNVLESIPCGEEMEHEGYFLKFNCLINESMYDKALELTDKMKTCGFKTISLLFRAELYFYTKNISKSEALFEKILKENKCIHAIKGYIKVLAEKKEYEKAYSLVAECYKLDHLNRDCIINMGVINTYLGNYAGAWDYLENAVAIYNDSTSLDYAGWAAARTDDFKKAKTYFEKSIEASPNNAYAYYQLGYVLKSSGNHYTALDKLLKSIEINDNDPAVYIELGSTYDGLKQYRKAVKSYLKALRLGVKEPYLLAHIGSAYGKLKVYQRAIYYLKTACDQAPSYMWAFEELVYYLRQTGESLKNKNDFKGYRDSYSAAVSYLKKAIKYTKNETWLFNELGYAYESLDNFEKAAYYYRKSLKIKESDYSYAHLGFCQRNLHKMPSAISNIKKSLTLNPSYFWAISELAYCYEIKKDYFKAEKTYYKALSIKPDDPYSTAHLGYIYLEKALKMRRKMGKARRNTNIDKAIYFFKKSLEIDPSYVWALSELGYTLRLIKNYSQACYYLERAAGLNQRDEWILNELGYCYEQTKEYKKASDSFIKVIELDMNNSYAYAHLGHVNRNMNNINQAILYLIKSIRLNPRYFWAVTELGICLREKKWYKTAVAIYNRAINEVGKDSWILNDMGYCYEQLGIYDEAERCFLKSSEININDEYPIAHLGNISILKGNYDEAEYNLKKSLQINPAYAWAHNKLSEVYERKNNYLGSVEFIEKLLERTGNAGHLMIKKASYLREQKEYHKALEYLDKIDNDVAFIEKAANYWLLKEPDTARNIIESAMLKDKKLYKDYKQLEKKALLFYKNEETIGFANLLAEIALNIEPSDYSLNITKAIILNSLKKYDAAIGYYKKAIKKVPNNHTAWERLAESYYLIKDHEKALMCVKKALSLNKNISSVHSLYAKILLSGKHEDTKVLFHLKHSIALDKNNEDANYLMAKVLFDNGFNEDALNYLEKYLRIVYKGSRFIDGIKLKNSIKKAIKNHNN